MGEKDLVYLGTMILLANRGGAITVPDIEKAIFVSKKVFNTVFEEDKPI